MSADVIHPWETENGDIVCRENMTMYICVYCGDGVCGKREDWCICPEDCAKFEIEDLKEIRDKFEEDFHIE